MAKTNGEHPPLAGGMLLGPKWRCAEGHEYSGEPPMLRMAIGQDGRGGTQMVAAPCCVVCLVQWAGKTFGLTLGTAAAPEVLQ